MKVLILTEGGEKVGLGHLTRCIALYQAFESQKICAKIVINGNKKLDFFLKNINHGFFNWIGKDNKLVKELSDVQAVLIDSYLASKDFYYSISKKLNEKLLIVIDDYNRMKYPPGIIINPSIYGEDMQYPYHESSVVLKGREYIILRKEFLEIPPKKININLKKVLITFGGIRYIDLQKRLVSYISERFSFIDVHIIDPRNNKVSITKLISLMLRNDLCISGGGQTLNEAARVGLPTIGICFAENQRLNLEKWSKIGFIKYAGWFTDKDFLEKIACNIESLMLHSQRIKCENIGKKNVDGKGSLRIVQAIKKIIKGSIKNNEK